MAIYGYSWLFMAIESSRSVLSIVLGAALCIFTRFFFYLRLFAISPPIEVCRDAGGDCRAAFRVLFAAVCVKIGKVNDAAGINVLPVEDFCFVKYFFHVCLILLCCAFDDWLLF